MWMHKKNGTSFCKGRSIQSNRSIIRMAMRMINCWLKSRMRILFEERILIVWASLPALDLTSQPAYVYPNPTYGSQGPVSRSTCTTMWSKSTKRRPFVELRFLRGYTQFDGPFELLNGPKTGPSLDPGPCALTLRERSMRIIGSCHVCRLDPRGSILSCVERCMITSYLLELGTSLL